MSAARIAALPDKTTAPVVLATGAIEQHGPHLPVAVDSFLAQVWLTLTDRRIPRSTSYYIAPPITIGKSNEHVGYPGTLFISKTLLRLQLFAIARQIQTWGFRSLVILNTHGGNSAVLAYTLREIHTELGLCTGFLRPKVTLPIGEQEALYGFHANEFESALMLATAPDYTKSERAVRHYPAFIGEPGELRPENAPATFSWASQDISPSGIMGDAPAGTAEKGRAWMEPVADGFAAEIVRWCETPGPRAHEKIGP